MIVAEMFRVLIEHLILAVIISKWGCSLAECQPKECSVEYFVPEINLSPDKDCYSDGDSANLTCNGNFGGPPSNQCNGGSWTLPPSSCEVFTCQRPETPPTLILSPNKTSYSAKEILAYSCTKGHQLIGASVSLCDQPDTWNPPTIPNCLVSCNMTAVGNATFSYPGPYNEGDVITITCDDGFSLGPGASSAMTCTENGWNSVPVCYPNCLVPAVDNSDHMSDQELTHEETIEIHCDDGYSFNQEHDFPLQCNNSVISGVIPNVCYSNCLVPAVNNSDHMGDRVLTNEETIEIHCDDGYSFNQEHDFQLQCNNSVISGVIPNVCSLDCDPLSPPIDGEVSGHNLHGTTTSYTCDSNSTLNGATEATCENGIWSNGGGVYRCNANCLVPAVGNSDHMGNRVLTHEETIKIHCDDGYSFNQEHDFQLQCNNSVISGVIPNVCYLDCDPLSAPIDGEVSGHYHHGTTAFYTCDSKSSLNGTTEATCENGIWSNGGGVYRCYEVICSAPEITTGPLLLEPIKKIYSQGETITYSCDGDLELNGSASAICEKTNEWKPSSLPTCSSGHVPRVAVLLLFVSAFIQANM
ncbi:complement factor H-like isoform X2 [Apostichopus japonicus]|uniref:complement factor H-like isoform X2 n=1 Tax=Stichopus japonicus TaxID=307972 RepID=UPI003AB5FE03